MYLVFSGASVASWAPAQDKLESARGSRVAQEAGVTTLLLMLVLMKPNYNPFRGLGWYRG